MSESAWQERRAHLRKAGKPDERPVPTATAYLTSADWYTDYCRYDIVDPDGWRDLTAGTAATYWWSVPITRKEFEHRLNQSSVVGHGVNRHEHPFKSK